MKQYAIAMENWHWRHRSNVVEWLRENYGEGGNGIDGKRWGEHNDYGLENLYMNEDVYIMYLLKWS